MLVGQPVFFWLARKGGGMLAAGHLLSTPEVQAAPSWQLPFWTPLLRAGASDEVRRVRVRYMKKFAHAPLTRDFLKLNSALAKQQPIGPVYVGTNFAMSQAAVHALAAYLR